MNVYMTGATRLQANAIKVRHIHKLDVPSGLVDVMQAHGAKVTWQVTPLGDRPFELFQSDLVWVSVAPGGSTNAPYLLGALWTIYVAKVAKLPCVIFYDDWQSINLSKMYGSMRAGGLEGLTRLVWGKPLYAETVESMVEHWSAIEEVLSDFETGAIFDYAVGVIPKFHNFGDISIAEAAMPVSTNLYSVDPTPFSLNDWADNSYAGQFTDKQRSWLLASLMPHDKWVKKQGITWPVEYIGSRKLKAPRLKTEKLVAEAYHSYVGVLSPEYPQAGSGWFRTRFLYSAGGLCVLFCGEKDAVQFGEDSWAFATTIRHLECMDELELFERAVEQQTIIQSRVVTSTEMTHNEISAIYAEARRKV